MPRKVVKIILRGIHFYNRKIGKMMKIQIDQNNILFNKVTAGGTGFSDDIELSCYGGKNKHFGNFDSLIAFKLDIHKAVPDLNSVIDNLSEKKNILIKFLKDKKTNESISFGRIIIEWDRDCYIIRYSGPDSSRSKPLSYYSAYGLCHALMRVFTYNTITKDISSIDELNEEINKEFNIIKESLDNVSWIDLDKPKKIIPSAPKRKREPGNLKISVNLKRNKSQK